MSDERTYEVRGMTCQHCVDAVESEVAAIEGAEQVTVELDGGLLAVRGDVDEGDVRAAVEEAGYSLA